MAIHRFGGPEELQETDVDDPLVGPDSVLIRIEAAGVNPVDVHIREGGLAALIPHFFPVIPGWDAAGVVEAVGPAVTDFAPGDEVLAYCRKDYVQAGCYAERVSVRDWQVAHRGSLDAVSAGGLPLAGLTAYQCLHDALGVREGETVVVRGASGGVGHLAVQLAKAAGARVVAIARAANEGFVRELGADEFADYMQDDLPARVAALRPDALVDLAGRDGLVELAAALPEGGRIVSVLVPYAPEGLDREFHYIFVRPSSPQLTELVRLVGSGALRIEIAHTLPLSDAPRAQERIEAGGVRGKLVLSVY